MCKRVGVMAATALMLSAGGLCAQSRGGSWVDELGTIDAQIQILQKRDQLRVQQEANSKTCLAGLPKVSSIASFGGRRSALLMFPGGQVNEVEVGDPVTASAKVHQIDVRGVQVQMRCGLSQALVSLDFAPPARQLAAASAVAAEVADAPLPQGSLRPSSVVSAPAIRLDMPLPPVPSATGAR